MQEDYSNPKNFKDISRPSWDEYFMMTAKLAGIMGTCLKRRVGSVVVKNKRIISTGFNGAPPGLPHCTEVGCLIIEGESDSCNRALHSEHNAILQDSDNMKDATLYISYLPCLNCMKTIISAKIWEIVYEKDPPIDKEKYRISKEFIQGANIKLRQIPEVNLIKVFSKYSSL